MHGRPAVVELEPDPDLRDSEQVPLLEEGGVEAFVQREVLPYAPDAWIDAGSSRIGYEISFTRYFYQPQPLRTSRRSAPILRHWSARRRGCWTRSSSRRGRRYERRL